MNDQARPDTTSEKLFADYLTEVLGLESGTAWEFEREWKGIATRPDFHVWTKREHVLLDCKEFKPRQRETGAYLVDPYAAIRAKIDDAKRQFKPFKDLRVSCGLVLLSGDHPETDTTDSSTVLGAMLGDEGFSWPVDRSGQAQVDMQPVFLKRGKMREPNTGRPRNTTIGAILDIRRRNPLWEACQAGMEVAPTDAHGNTIDTKFEKRLSEKLAGDGFTENRELCVTVHENPFARISFPSHIFTGPYDSCWGRHGNVVREIFCGERLREAGVLGRWAAKRMLSRPG